MLGKKKWSGDDDHRGKERRQSVDGGNRRRHDDYMHARTHASNSHQPFPIFKLLRRIQLTALNVQVYFIY